MTVRIESVRTIFQLPINNSTWTLVRTNGNNYEYISLPRDSASTSVSVNAGKNTESATPKGVVTNTKKYRGYIEIPQDMLRWLGVSVYSSLYIKFTSPDVLLIAKYVTDEREYTQLFVNESGRCIIRNSHLLAAKENSLWDTNWEWSSDDRPSDYSITKNGSTNNALIVKMH
jgi:hypothetical protein